MSIQQGGHLSPGDRLVRAEAPIGVSEFSGGASSGDSIGDGPADRSFGITSFAYVTERFRSQERCGGSAGGSPQEGDELLAGEVGVGTEEIESASGGDVVKGHP